MLKVSKRLNAIVSLIPNHVRVLADVGTDHSQLIIKLILDQKLDHAYGLDIASGPLMQAQNNVVHYNLEDKIDLIKTDGLNGFEENVDCIVIAGMGAETIMSIVNAYNFAENHVLIVQSNTKQPWLRKSLNEAGFKIDEELFIFDNEKPVFIVRLSLGLEVLDDKDLILGKYLPTKKNVDYIQYLQRRYIELKKVVLFNQDIVFEMNIIESYLSEVNYERQNI